MVSEVHTSEFNALVTCEFFMFKRLFTLEVPNKQLTLKVSSKFILKFSLIVCCIKDNLKGHP